MVVVDLEVLNLLDLSVRPPDGQSFDQCCRPEANVLFDGAAAHESAGWEDVADELVGVGIDNELTANSAAVAGVSHERHDGSPALWHAIFKQTQRATSHRADQQIQITIPVEVGRNDGT